jgi:hypothetical protein
MPCSVHTQCNTLPGLRSTLILDAGCLLGCCAGWYGKDLPMFRGYLLPLSSGRSPCNKFTFYSNTRLSIPKDRRLYNHGRENLKSRVYTSFNALLYYWANITINIPRVLSGWIAISFSRRTLLRGISYAHANTCVSIYRPKWWIISWLTLLIGLYKRNSRSPLFCMRYAGVQKRKWFFLVRDDFNYLRPPPRPSSHNKENKNMLRFTTSEPRDQHTVLIPCTVHSPLNNAKIQWWLCF